MNRGRRARARASTPSGVATVIRVVEVHVSNARRVRRATERRRGPSSSSSSTRAGSRPAALGADGVRRLGATYRATAADLAIARRQFPGDPVRRPARTARAARPARRCTTRRAARGTRARVRRARATGGACASGPACSRSRSSASFGPTLLGGLLGVARSRARRAGSCPASTSRSREPRTPGEDSGISVDEQSAFASEIFTNNIRVDVPRVRGRHPARRRHALRADAQRRACSARSFGLAIGAGNGRPFFELVARARRARAELHRRRGRGRAADRLGDHRSRAPRPRGEALRAEARAAVEIVLGTALLARASPASSKASSRRRAQALGDRARRRLRARRRSSGACVFWRGARRGTGRGYRRARDFEPQVRRARTLRPSGAAALRSPTAPDAAQPGRDTRARRRARRARPRRRRRRACDRGSRATARRGRGRCTDATTTAWRRASTGTASSSERAAASSTRSVNTMTRPRLPPPTARNARS